MLYLIPGNCALNKEDLLDDPPGPHNNWQLDWLDISNHSIAAFTRRVRVLLLDTSGLRQAFEVTFKAKVCCMFNFRDRRVA